MIILIRVSIKFVNIKKISLCLWYIKVLFVSIGIVIFYVSDREIWDLKKEEKYFNLEVKIEK